MQSQPFEFKGALLSCFPTDPHSASALRCELCARWCPASRASPLAVNYDAQLLNGEFEAAPAPTRKTESRKPRHPPGDERRRRSEHREDAPPRPRVARRKGPARDSRYEDDRSPMFVGQSYVLLRRFSTATAAVAAVPTLRVSSIACRPHAAISAALRLGRLLL
jgi:hypothetical protein